ncbi:alkaline phosphatase family protein [Virgibacillus sp. LDC-1]|uniref:alkaline phosphatase family protein n=1 Tax=Virgibacillus sp. LDC-1 TaxID=3039856 RepID=UPI0024DEC608|nr:alkaline phosphatase family protein [Virgibacillus sp. LDC-1]
MEQEKNQKPVILLNIDSLMPQALETAIQTGRAPALKFLMEKGYYSNELVTSFPTMSVTIDTSLLTGTYPNEHKIPGLHWFDTTWNSFVNYGTGFRETIRIGARRTIHNMLYRLNNVHMNKEVTTIHEELAKLEIPTASINSFVYRGNFPRQLHVPRLLRPFTQLEASTLTPSIFSLGVFSRIRPRGIPLQITAGNFTYAARELRYLIQEEKLPGFTFCIFQDMDARIHLKGPFDMKGIKKVDKEIKKILDMYDSWKNALDENIWLVIGDNGHAATGSKRRNVVIDLRKLLSTYKLAQIERPVRKNDQLAICVNQRMAYIYVLDEGTKLKAVANYLHRDQRIDVIAWRENESITVISGGKKNSLVFQRGGDIEDRYKQSWRISGDLTLLDLTINDSKLIYGDYPDALARLYGALFSQEGRFLVVNAQSGCEFKAQSTPTHLSGAAHGSLNKQESLVPLIIAGTEQTPTYNRIIDLKAFILKLLTE